MRRLNITKILEDRTTETPKPKKWGRWTYDPKLMTLEIDDYQIDLEPITSSAEILDWVAQIHGKAWITPKDFHDLLSALKSLLNPQAHYCSFGQDKRLPAKKLLQAR